MDIEESRQAMDSENGTPLISVVVPVYKVEAYLERCIHSLIAQTYHNLEILLVDDGSPDKCGQICDAWAAQDPRVVSLHKENGGLSDARNYGTARARGEYVTFVDSDDYVSPDYVSYLYELMMKYQADIACCDCIWTYADNIFDAAESDTEEERLYTGREACATLLKGIVRFVTAWGKLYRVDTVRAFPFPKGRIHEDEATTFQYYCYSKTVAIGDRKLYAYFQNPNGIMGQLDDRKINTDGIWVRAYRAEHLESLHERELAKLAWTGLFRYCLDDSIQHNGRADAYLKRYWKYGRTTLIIHVKLALWLYCRPLFMSCKNGLIRKLWNKASMLKKRMTGFFRHIRHFRRYDENTVFLLGVPEYGNLGDQAIALAIITYFEMLFPDAELVPITESQWEEQFWPLIACIRKYGNLCLLMGGGNMGELYPPPERIRLKAMRYLRRARLVMFPQSVDYTEQSPALNRVRKIYERCPRLTLFLRDRTSYEKAKRFFPKCDCRLCPDIAMTLNPDIRTERKNFALFCVRGDIECAALECLPLLESACAGRGLQVRRVDNAHDIFAAPMEEQKENLRRQWKLFASATVVVTNRIHGMIFACITRTPCLVFDNSTGKVLDYYHTWLEDSGVLALNNSMSDEEALHCLDAALRQEEGPSMERYQPLFKGLEEALRTTLEETRHEM